VPFPGASDGYLWTRDGLVFRDLGGDDMVRRALAHRPGGAAGAVLIVMLAMLLLGFVMDAFEIIFVVVPIVAPALLMIPGVDPIWLGVMMAMNCRRPTSTRRLDLLCSFCAGLRRRR
jgi:TRAP-type mannitol/chloroaromatic compound transport system permease large subunit